MIEPALLYPLEKVMAYNYGYIDWALYGLGKMCYVMYVKNNVSQKH